MGGGVAPTPCPTEGGETPYPGEVPLSHRVKSSPTLRVSPRVTMAIPVLCDRRRVTDLSGEVLPICPGNKAASSRQKGQSVRVLYDCSFRQHYAALLWHSDWSFRTVALLCVGSRVVPPGQGEYCVPGSASAVGGICPDSRPILSGAVYMGYCESFCLSLPQHIIISSMHAYCIKRLEYWTHICFPHHSSVRSGVCIHTCQIHVRSEVTELWYILHISQSSPIHNPLSLWVSDPVQSKSAWTGRDYESSGLIQTIPYSGHRPVHSVT